jgi:hypothetical protein
MIQKLVVWILMMLVLKSEACCPLACNTNILSRVGYVTRLITSRYQGCSDYLFCIHFYTPYNSVSRLLFNCLWPWLDFNSSLAAIFPLFFLRRLMQDFPCILWRLSSDWLCRSVALSLSAYVGVLQTGYEAPFAKVLSRVFGNPLRR